MDLHTAGPTPLTCRAVGEAWDWLKTLGAIAELDGNSNGWHYVTDRGKAIAESEEPLSRMEAEARIGSRLHKSIDSRIQSQTLLGEYESAVLLAFREVEIRVRSLGGFPDSLLGVKLMQEAFKSSGPLSDPNLDPGEQVAVMNLFSGAIGAFKNPSSHRQVDYGDVTIASEAILLADLLLRMLDQVEKRVNPQVA